MSFIIISIAENSKYRKEQQQIKSEIELFD